MTILLDTCALLWMATDKSKLSPVALAALSDPLNRRLLSAISVLEISVKAGIGKLKLGRPLDQFVAVAMKDGDIKPLPVSIEHSVAVAGLPLHHRDPFDRLLVAQAVVEDIPIVTNDTQISKYSVRVVW